MKHRRFIVLFASASVAVLTFAGCTAPIQEGSNKGPNDEANTQVIESASKEVCKNKSPKKVNLADLKIGFSQSENEQNPFRAVETESMKQSIKEAGAELLYTNANGDQAKQLSDIQSMINQDVDALVVAPLNATGLQSAFSEAAAKGVPVVTIDRLTEGTVCEDYLTFMGSDFYEQGVRAAEALVEATGGSGKIAEIQGAPGNDVARLRTEGFESVISKYDGLKVVAQQTANWSTSEAQDVVSQIVSANPGINGVYTHSDSMALGALSALDSYGKKPGEDVFLVSIDGSKDAVSEVAQGRIFAVVETNPRFGPAAMKAFKDWFSGEQVSQQVIMKDAICTKENAQEAVDSGAAY